MFREALGYPTRSPEGGRSVIIGGLALTVVGLCVGIATTDVPYAYLAVAGLLPWLVVRGYYVRVIRTTIGRQKPVPPRFDDLRRLLGDGTIAVGIAIIYLLPPLAVLGPLVAIQAFEVNVSSLAVAGPVSDAAGTVIVPIVGLFAIVALMALLGSLYVLPVAVARFSHSGQWRDALEFRTVIGGAMTEDYAIAWGVSFLIQALLLPIAYVFQILLFGFFLQFIVGVGVRYCYGQGVGAALKLSPVESSRGSGDLETSEGEGDTESPRTPKPAFVRVDTAAWGIDPGEGAEPMTKSVLIGRSNDDSVSPEAVERSAGSADESAERDGEREDEMESEKPELDLRPAFRRVSDDPSDDE